MNQFHRMKVGMSFNPSSSLQLRAPPTLLEKIAITTTVAFYVNVSRAARGDDRAFLLYIGNEEGTHTKLPDVSTDDYMALEVVEGGR